MKKCSKCGIEKKLCEFGADKRKPDGKKYQCKSCHNAENLARRQANPEKHRTVNLAYARSDRGRALQRANSLRRKFWPNLTNEQAVAEYDRLLLEQKNSCALCGRHQSTMKTNFHVDHCHETNTVRGLLCGPCNRVEVQDKTLERVLKLVAYFTKYHTIK
jgi:hypothetical protein